MSKQRGNANRTSGVAASSPVTGLLPFATMTCEESAQATPRASMSSAAASPVRTCLTRGRALASRVSAAVCGTSSRESFANYDPESSSWRTSQRSLLGDWTPFSEAFPKRGMMRSGSMSALPMSGRHTDASDSSSSRGDAMWNTPTVEDAGRNGSAEWARRWASGETIPETQQRLRTQALWPTPAAMMPNDSEDPQEWLARAALLKEKHHNGNGAGTPLAVAVKLAGSAWPTPRSCSAVWATITPEAQEKAGERFPNIESIVAITEGTAAVGAALSPAWVEMLMGFPEGWVDPLPETTKRKARR